MVGFGDKLQHEGQPEWEHYYLDYDQLKHKLDGLVDAQEKASKDPGTRAYFEALRTIFQGLLDAQIEKVVDFYHSKLAELNEEVKSLHLNSELFADAPDMPAPQRLTRINERLAALQGVAPHITRLLGYVSLNMTAIRKIMKKMAKHIPPAAPLPGFVTLEISHPHDPNWHILQGTFLTPDKAEALKRMGEHTALLCAGDAVRAEAARLREARSRILSARSSLLARGMSFVQRASDFDAALLAMEEARVAARRNAALVAALTPAEKLAGIFERPPPDAEAAATLPGLALHCAASTLYMANYMLAVPTIALFCRRIGVSPSLAGAIIGSSDFASMFMTPAYSLWSNRSFKYPVAAGAIACLAGNLLYALSYDARALWMLMLSRFLIGFGSSRTVTRRYIADYVSKSNRTKASQAFVCSGAVGMAFGPLLALVFKLMPRVVLLGLTFDSVTMAAWTMIACWIVFIVAWMALFPEPPIRHLPPVPREATNGAALHEPLLAGQEGSADGKPAPGTDTAGLPGRWSWEVVTGPTLVSIGVLWALKMIQQGYVDGLPIFAEPLFGWDSSNTGLLLAVLGLCSLPVSAVVGYLSAFLRDRALTLAALAVTGGGAALLATAARPPWTYFAGGAGVYFGSLVLEGAGMSLLSKVIHPRLAHGLFNMGLLATEAGTLGRFSGNIVMSLAARATGVDTLLQLRSFAIALYGFFAAVAAALCAACLLLWRRLAT